MAIGAPNAGTATTFAAATTSAVPFPTTTRSGNYLILPINFQGAATSCTTPTGWTLLGTLGGTGSTLAPTLFVFGKYAAGTEGGTSLTVTHGSVANRAQIVEWAGVDGSTAMDVALTSVDSSAGGQANCVIPSITPVSSGATLVTFSSTNTATQTATPPTNFTELSDGTGATATLEVAYLQNVQPVASGTATVVWSGAGKQVGIMVALRPASDVPSTARTLRRRPAWFGRRRATATQVYTTTVVVTAQALPPQQQRNGRVGWLPRRRAKGTQVIQTQAVLTAPLPAQPVRRLLRLPVRSRRAATFVPPTVTVVTAQALPPQPARRPAHRFYRPSRRTATFVPTTTIQVTAQALPPQQGRRGAHRFFRPARRFTTTVPPTTVTVTTTQALPPQQGRRGAHRFYRPAKRSTTNVYPTVTVVTTQALPPQPIRDRLAWFGRRRATATTVPPRVVAVPPQQPTRRRLAPFVRRTRATQTVFTVTVVTTPQALPPQPGRHAAPPTGWLARRRRRTVEVLAQAVAPVVTAGTVQLGTRKAASVATGVRKAASVATGVRKAAAAATAARKAPTAVPGTRAAPTVKKGTR